MSYHCMKGGLQSFKGILTSQSSSTLIVGDIERWTAEGRETTSTVEYVFAQFPDVTIDLLRRIKPEVVLSPLIGDNFDALDMVEALCACRYDGPYRAITGPIIKPDLIRRELTAAGPFLDVDLIVMPATPT